MNTKDKTREQISAFADGECADLDIEATLVALRNREGKADWDLYHRLGDVLRSDDMNIQLSSGFAARMAARLDAEPLIVASVSDKPAVVACPPKAEKRDKSVKRWAMPGMIAAAAAAATTFIATPQLMVAIKGEGTNSPVSTMAAAVGDVRSTDTPAVKYEVTQGALVAASVPEGVVLRDARIDDYLFAHQRFSPSVYSTAQYARSATFATDSDK